MNDVTMNKKKTEEKDENERKERTPYTQQAHHYTTKK